VTGSTVAAGTVFVGGSSCYDFAVFLRSQLATIGALSYLLAFLAASLYPRISHQTFAGLTALMLLWLPWIDLVHPTSHFVLVAFALLNAAIIYAVLALLSILFSRLLRRP
jgi:hypothetical protein